MPEYAWRGRDGSGNEVSGTLTANSKSEALLELLQQKVLVSSVTKVGGQESRPKYNVAFGRAFYAFTAFAIGGFLILLAPVDVIRCTPSHDCRIEHRLAGFYLLGAEDIANVEKASVSNESYFFGSTIGQSSRVRKESVELESRSGVSIRTDAMSTAVMSCTHVVNALNRFLKSPAKGDFVTWQGEAVLGLPLLLLFVSYKFVRGAVRALRSEE